MRALTIAQRTTSTRAFVLQDGVLRPVLARAHRPRSCPVPGRVAHDADELLSSLCPCLDAATAVGCVGLDNQGESCVDWPQTPP